MSDLTEAQIEFIIYNKGFQEGRQSQLKDELKFLKFSKKHTSKNSTIQGLIIERIKQISKELLRGKE